MKELKGKVVTYHDPCHLGRHMALEIEQEIIEESKNLMMDSRKIRQVINDWYEIPRIVLRQLEEDVGIKFQEMYRIKLDSFCCGAGGGVKSGFKDWAVEISEERIKEAQETGAQYLTTTCPFCLNNLRDAARMYKTPVQVVDLLELVKKAIE